MNGKVNRIGGGNCAIKGIIEEAKAKGIITAGDFVTYINKLNQNNGIDTNLNMDSGNTGNISAVRLRRQ